MKLNSLALGSPFEAIFGDESIMFLGSPGAIWVVHRTGSGSVQPVYPVKNGGKYLVGEISMEQIFHIKSNMNTPSRQRQVHHGAQNSSDHP